jgi:peptidoglycan/LPS O-acetylase OafA/YrhL
MGHLSFREMVAEEAPMKVSIWKNARTAQFWRPVTKTLFLMITGAWLLISYIATRMPSVDLLKDVRNDVQLAWWILFIAWCATAPRDRQAYKDPSPARSGTTVVVVCGIAAAIFLWRDGDWPRGLIVPGLILLGTAVVAVFVYRYASNHALEIGEARFNTVTTSQHQDG